MNTEELLHLHSYLTMGFIQHPMFHTITDKWGCGAITCFDYYATEAWSKPK